MGDVEITLNDIDSYGKASLVIKVLERGSVGETSGVADGGETSGTSGTTQISSGGLGIIWWILIIIVVIVIVVLVLPKKKRK